MSTQVTTTKDVKKFFIGLEKRTYSKVLQNLSLLETYGHLLGPPRTKLIRNNLYELRIRGHQEVRLFYTFFNNRIIVIYGFIKKQNQIPKQVLELLKYRLDSI